MAEMTPLVFIMLIPVHHAIKQKWGHEMTC